jgi:hypothetical protein
MYCRIALDSEIWVDFRKGSDRMLELCHGTVSRGRLGQ